jgi:NAD(P)-dependent dehydrogenase (short-subunit alcohol dehydrogenase family)
VAIVTGGAKGIGAAIVSGLAEEGAAVVIADTSEHGEATAERLRSSGAAAQFVRTDISKADQVAKLALTAEEKFGSVDILVNCAGIFPRANLLDTDEALWDQIIDINLKGVYLCCRAIVPLMKKRGGGSIVNIGSGHATTGSAELFAYAVSKGGLLTMTRNLARALASDNIRVNCVNPGWVASDGEIALRATEGHSAEWLRDQGRNTPLGRLQTGEDLAAAVVFFTLPQANQITGQILAVDAGMSVR